MVPPPVPLVGLFPVPAEPVPPPDPPLLLLLLLDVPPPQFPPPSHMPPLQGVPAGKFWYMQMFDTQVGLLWHSLGMHVTVHVLPDDELLLALELLDVDPALLFEELELVLLDVDPALLFEALELVLLDVDPALLFEALELVLLDVDPALLFELELVALEVDPALLVVLELAELDESAPPVPPLEEAMPPVLEDVAPPVPPLDEPMPEEAMPDEAMPLLELPLWLASADSSQPPGPSQRDGSGMSAEVQLPVSVQVMPSPQSSPMHSSCMTMGRTSGSCGMKPSSRRA
jgi:hypothetical protein